MPWNTNEGRRLTPFAIHFLALFAILKFGFTLLDNITYLTGLIGSSTPAFAAEKLEVCPDRGQNAPDHSFQEAWGKALEFIANGDYFSASEVLIEVPEEGLPSQKLGELEFLRGYSLKMQGLWEEASPHLERAISCLPILADYALFYLAEARRNSGDLSGSVQALESLTTHFPDSLLSEKDILQRAQDLYELGDWEGTGKAIQRFLELYPRSPGSPKAIFLLGLSLLELERLERAEEVLRSLYLERPESQEADKARAYLGGIPSFQPFNPKEILQRAFLLYKAGLHRKALAELNPFLEGDSPPAPFRLLTGLVHFQLRDYKKTISVLEPLMAGPLKEKEEAQYWTARSWERLGMREKARQIYKALARPPKNPWADKALFQLAQGHEEEKDWSSALVAYKRLIKEHPKSSLRDEAFWRRGWVHYRLRNYKESYRELKALLSLYPHSPFSSQALYWQGKALESWGKKERAYQVYRSLLSLSRMDYYTLKAEERLSGHYSSGGGIRATETRNSSKSQVIKGNPPPPRDYPHLDKARALERLGLNEEAGEEYWALVRANPEDLGLIDETSRFFLKARRYDRPLWLAKRYLQPLYLQFPSSTPLPQYWEYLYPLGYFDIAAGQAYQYSLDPYLIMALIREESSFSRKAVSRAGARGLMQVMPLTALNVAKTLLSRFSLAEDLERPETNMALGTAYLVQMLNDFQGNLPLALAAYNAGPHNLKRWLEESPFTEEAEFIENIPFPETRAYVKRVLLSYHRYKSLYGKKEESLSFEEKR